METEGGALSDEGASFAIVYIPFMLPAALRMPE